MKCFPIAGTSNMRWIVCAMLFLATIISYINRQAVAIVAPMLAAQFHLNNEQIGRILSSFLLAYTFGQLIAGRIFDRIGSRAGFALSIGVWSLANVLTAAANSLAAFVSLRFVLGAGESGNFPGGVKTVSEWFPASERSLAGGLFASGASIGAIVAGPLVGSIAHYWGWRPAFVVTGSLGFIWMAGWLIFYRNPVRVPGIGAQSERQQDGMRWLDLLRFRQIWALAIARMLEEPVLWLGIFWLPKYAVDVRHLSMLQAGWLLVEPYIALDAGYILGGWISSRLARLGWTPERSKVAVMWLAAMAMIGSIPAVQSGSAVAFFGLMSLAMFGHGAWFTNAMMLSADIAPPRLIASVYGIAALGGGMGGIIATETTGVVVDQLQSYLPIFVGIGIMPLIATAILATLGRGMTPLHALRSANTGKVLSR
jgi:ACS family hexuronate transporter-like MFS transporter